MKKKILPRAKSNRSASKSAARKGGRPPGRMYRRLSAAVAEMQAIRAGKAAPVRAWEVVADGKGGFLRRQIAPARKVPLAIGDPAKEAVQARRRLGLSQDMFAALLGVSAGTLRGWEQGRRKPARAARVLLRVAAQHPEAVLEAAKAAA